MGLFGLKLPKKLDDTWSGLDFWDKKENQQQRQVAAARPKAPIFTGNRDDQPGFQLGNNSLTRGLSRTYDQGNILDSGRSWKTRVISPVQEQASGWDQAYNQVIEPGIVTPIQHASNTIAATAAGGIGLGQAGYQSIFGTDADYQNKLNETQQSMRDLLDHGWGDKGGFGTSEGMENGGFKESFIKPVTQGVAEVGPLVIPFAPKGSNLATTALKAGAGNAAIGGTSDVAMQLADTGQVDPVEAMKATLLSGLGGAAAPVLGAGIRGAARQVPDVVVRGKEAMTPLNEGGYVQVGRTPKKVHPEDQGTMADFVDMARGVEKFSPKVTRELELMADHIAQRYGIVPKGKNTVKSMANAFAERLDQEGYGTTLKDRLLAPFKDEVGAVGRNIRVNGETPKSKVVVKGVGNTTRMKETPAPKQAKVTVRPAKNGNLQEIKRGLSDADQVILDELRSIEKQTGQKGLVDKFMYRSNQQRGSNRTANVHLERSDNVKEAIGNQGKKEADEFSTYANARTELAHAVRQRTPTGRQKKIKTSAPIEELQATVRGGQKAYGKRFKALNAHYKELADMAHEAGIIDKKTHGEYTRNKDYIRLQRDLEDKIPNATGGRGQGYKLGTTTLKQKRKGSTRATLDAAEVLAERTQQVHREVAKNKTGTMLVDTLEKAGLARKVSPTKSATHNTVSVFRDGKKVHYEVSAEMKEAMDNINPHSMNVVMQVLAAPGRVFRAGVTGLNPVFIARNLVKDQVGSAVNSKNMFATHNPKAFFSGLGRATADALGKKHNGELWDEFLKHYGDQTSYDMTRNVKDTKRVVSEIRGGKKVKVFNKLRSPIRSLEDIASVTEKSTRYQNFRGAYKSAIKQGMSKDAAMEHAAIQGWQNSVDFARAGTWGRTINTVLPYWNPSTQGVRQMGRTFKDRPISSTFKAVSLVGVPLVAATAWNTSDKDTKAIYDNIPEYEKDNNLILIPPGTKQNGDGTYDVLKIPLPPGVKDAVMPLRRAMEAFAHDKPADYPKMAEDILQVVAGPVQVGTPGQMAGSFIPQIAKPAVQATANKDFFTGKDIVPEYMNESTDAKGNPVKEKDKAYGSTSGTAMQLGKVFGMSPIKVEKFIKDSSGTVGLNLLNLADNLQANAGTISKDRVGGQSVSTGFKRSFANVQGEENEHASDGSKYFAMLKKLSDETKLTKSEKDAWGSLHPAKKNFLGEQVYENDATYDPAARLDIYNRFPKVYTLDKKIDAQGRKDGKPGNPMYDLENWQLKKVLEKENLPPGAKDPELTDLYKQEWFQNYRSGKTDFFNKLAVNAEKAGKPFGTSNNPYPVTPEDVQRAMDVYNGLAKGTGERSGWIKSNPGMWLKMQQQFAATDNWQNIARGKRGLDATEGDIGRMAGYDSGSSSGSSGYSSGGGSKGSTLQAADFVKKYSVGGSVKKGTPTSSGKVTVKARKSGGSGGKIKVTSKKLRLA